MKIADLYIRVSTDEQAEKGYSQRSQDELLHRYCQINNIFVRKIVYEDHSAKTFDRPAWNSYLLDLKRNKNKSDLVLFMKWDRFSRSAGDAYYMINVLRKLGVEPQAIEQPLDLTIPENKLMLAFFLAAPEVENERRALNVRAGNRRARKEGRYLGKAPYGYANKTHENGAKYIDPIYPKAGIVKWAYEQIAKGLHNVEEIYHMAVEKGYTSARSLFWFIIRNPLYCGKIFIPKNQDEEAKFIKGQHNPIVSEELYYKVQEILDGKKRSKYKLRVATDENMPLRGYLICPICSRLLTASASKGRSKYYHYYHCTDGCPTRFSADNVNDQFLNQLKRYIPKASIEDIYKSVLKQKWISKIGSQIDERKLRTT